MYLLVHFFPSASFNILSAKTNHNITALCILLYAIFACTFLHAQTVHSQLERNIQIQFLKDSIEAEENAFLFNNISLLYKGSSPVLLDISYVQSSLITVLSTSQINYVELQPNQQLIVPIRFNLSKGIHSTDWFAFTVNFLVKQTGQSIERKFWIRQKTYSKWKCVLPQPNIILKEQEDKSDFWVHVENTGNTEDIYQLEFESELEIELPKKDRTIILQPGQGKMIKAMAILDFQHKKHNKEANVSIYISNKAGEKRALYQRFSSIGNLYTQEVYRWKKMPLTIELGAQTSFDDQSYYTAALNGTVNLDKDKSLNLNIRTNDFSHHFKTNSSIATVEYATKDWNITGGTILGFNHFLINGTGLRLKHKTGTDGYIELAGINSNLNKTKQIDFKTQQPISQKISITNNSFVNLDAEQNTNSYLTVNKLNWAINDKNKLTIEAGAGTEHISKAKIDTTLAGPMYGYQFESNSGNLSLISSSSYYSKNFPGFNRGFKYHNHELRYKLSKFSFSGFYQADRKIFTNPEDSVLKVLFNTNEKEYGVRSGYQFQKVSASFSATIWQQQQDSVQSPISRTIKVASNISWMPSQGLSLSLFSNAGYVYLIDRTDIKPTFAITNFGSLQAKSFGMHFRYDRGPFYYYEIKQYAQYQNSFERLQIAPFYDKHFRKLNTSLRLQMNYTWEKPRDYGYLLVTSQFLYSPPKLNMDIGLLTRVDLKNNSNPLVNFTIRKRLQLPVIKNTDSYNFKLLLFKDHNDNNVFDGQDEVISHATILANKNWLMTDGNGIVDFKNISKDGISFDLSKISNLRGWIPTHGFVQTIVPEKTIRKVCIPFKKSKVISGKLVLVKDENSSLTMQLSNIRITASDNNGNQYSTLTDLNGGYSMSLPAGNYIVSVNEHVFDENFRPLEFSKTADLIHNNALDITFEIIQKKRQINIRKSE